MNSETKQCQNCKNQFTIEPDDFAFYEKMKVPPPTFCPECRIIRRFVWRNEINFYKRKCDATGKNIFSFFHKNAPVKVYEHSYWWSDKWNPMEYGKDYDFSRPFLEQLRELILQVPWPSRSIINLINSDYCMNANNLKDCYFLFHSSDDEGCYYGVGIEKSKDCFDNLYIEKSELCYQNVFMSSSSRVFYSNDIDQSLNIYFSKNLVNCSHCFGCVGLRNKNYHIFNRPYTKEEYFKKIQEFDLGSYKNVSKLMQESEDLWIKFPTKFANSNHNVDSSGEYVFDSKNVKNSYLIVDGENLKYCQDCIARGGVRDCYDYSIWGANAELVYDCSQVGLNVSQIKFCAFLLDSQRAEYSIYCPSSKDIFGCVGLRRKQYCILNKQYSKEEYQTLMPEIIQHMNSMPYVDNRGNTYKYGEFLPIDFSPFTYNESLAQEFFPLTKEQAKENNIKWKDLEEKDYSSTMSWNNLPNHINDVSDSIVKEIILCCSFDENEERAKEHNCTKAFKITPEELKFYKIMNLPLPRQCFYCRHYQRTKQRNPIKLWHRQCMCDYEIYKNLTKHSHHTEGKCPNEFETSYAPDRPEIVYCESCYNAEVV